MDRDCPPPVRLTSDQHARYRRDGYLVIREYLSEADLAPVDRGIERHTPRHAYAPRKVYPEPAKYTLSGQIAADPDLASIAEHPRVVGAVEQILGRAAHLSAYVVYVRTPWDKGSAPHNDYKRWRPVGSSMDWVFAIIPLHDFDLEHGPLLIAPGSHQLEKVADEPGGFIQRTRPTVPKEMDFVNPGLGRGDLLLMNMYTWHWALKNDRRRIGVFNKYTAADAPPATGPYVMSEAVYEAFTEPGRRLIAVHSDLPIGAARLLLVDADAILLVRSGPGAPWCLPGGAGTEEGAIPGWDVGSRIGALSEKVRIDHGLELPWMTYVGDYEEVLPGGPALCRVYAYPCRARPVLAGAGESRWFNRCEVDALDSGALGQDYLPEALRAWFDIPARRGKGLSQAASKVDQYAV